jgi:SagB-type dehydrogenase family enzyme
MKSLLLKIFLTILLFNNAFSQELKTIQLNPPDMERGFTVLKALSLRASAQDYDTASLKLQDLSELVWAANGINRPESGKRTAPSAINAQDIDVYVILKSGIYLYDPKKHSLEMITAGDHRLAAAGSQANAAKAPVICLLVSDISRFARGTESQKMIWAAEDAGIVSQNISLYCASAGLATRPRATMDQKKLKEALNLNESQHLMLNHPVSYIKE